MPTVRRKITSQTIMAFILIIFGMVVVMISLYLPPKGEIHPSVITVFGMILVAVGAFMGIDLNFQLRSLIRAHERSIPDISNKTTDNKKESEE